MEPTGGWIALTFCRYPGVPYFHQSLQTSNQIATCCNRAHLTEKASWRCRSRIVFYEATFLLVRHRSFPLTSSISLLITSADLPRLWLKLQPVAQSASVWNQVKKRSKVAQSTYTWRSLRMRKVVSFFRKKSPKYRLPKCPLKLDQSVEQIENGREKSATSSLFSGVKRLRKVQQSNFCSCFCQLELDSHKQ